MSFTCAPWTTKEIDILRARQVDKNRHPYTCAGCGTELEPRKRGWYCPVCNGIVQDWAYTVDMDDYR